MSCELPALGSTELSELKNGSISVKHIQCISIISCVRQFAKVAESEFCSYHESEVMAAASSAVGTKPMRSSYDD